MSASGTRFLILRRVRRTRLEGRGIVLCRYSPLPPRQQRQACEIAAHIGFLLGTRPAFDAALGGYRFIDAFIIFAEDKLHRQTAGRVAALDKTLRVFAHAFFDTAMCDASV